MARKGQAKREGTPLLPVVMAALAIGTPEDKERVAARLDQLQAAGNSCEEEAAILGGLRDLLRGSSFQELCRRMRPGDALMLKQILALGEGLLTLGDG